MSNDGKGIEQRLDDLQETIGKQQSLIREMETGWQRDEKALKAARAQIIRAERLQLAGTVAAQIAHDFRNILAPIMMLPPVIKKHIPEDNPCVSYLAEIEKAAKDMVEMTEDLSVLSTRGQLDFELIDANDVLHQLTTMLERKAEMRDVAMTAHPGSDILPIKGSPGQFARAMQNLMENAIDAMMNGGQMTISTENVYLDEPFGEYDTVRVGEYILIRVSDTGDGICEEVRNRIFDPFFTTKKSSKQRSSGLGLSIVHSVVKDHGGYIDLESSPKSGTTFSLYFPICRDIPEHETVDDVVGGPESILIVDDDAQQVELMSLLLTTLGYKVEGVNSGSAAVNYLEANKADLIVIDMVMPGMDGAETLRRIKKINEEQRAIIVSGFTDCPGREVARELGATRYIKKPITLEDIGHAAREELDR